jgi:hypothetical protein
MMETALAWIGRVAAFVGSRAVAAIPCAVVDLIRAWRFRSREWDAREAGVAADHAEHVAREREAEAREARAANDALAEQVRTVRLARELEKAKADEGRAA